MPLEHSDKSAGMFREDGGWQRPVLIDTQCAVEINETLKMK